MAEIFVDPDGDGQGLHPTSLTRALRSARPGDEIILRAGRYTRPVTITRSGTKTAPIIIRSEEARLALMDGGQTPATDNGLGLELTKDSFAFIKCLNAKHVQLKGLQFRHCWPASVYIENSKGIRVSYCLGVGSRAFVFARQTGDQKTCKHILIEGCGWVQDPDFDMWEGRATWSEIKNDIGHGNKSHFNGAFFASNNIAGKVSIRHNTISHAFNAIRMEIDYGFVEGSQTKPEITRNRDVAIYGNSFAFIRDNAIEPEIGAQNWRVADNRFFNVHAAISLDKVAMRDVIVIGNTFLNNRQPGVQGTENQGGRIIKFIKPRHNEPPDKDRPRKDFWILFNSIQTRTTYTKKGITTFWRDYGNAFASLPKTHPRPGPVRRIMPGMDWSGDVEIRFLATNDPDYPTEYAEGRFKTFKTTFDPVFAPCDPSPEPKEPLGGWSGQLHRSDAVEALRCDPLTIEGADGKVLKIKHRLPPGAHACKKLGLTKWLERHWDPYEPEP
ncbi:MAG: hypothetical protein HRU31_07040 [Rhodobacteraceae bacterium]|nr:hypothetical protein [Paracoccaceae bacterium]